MAPFSNVRQDPFSTNFTLQDIGFEVEGLLCYTEDLEVSGPAGFTGPEVLLTQVSFVGEDGETWVEADFSQDNFGLPEGLDLPRLCEAAKEHLTEEAITYLERRAEGS